ncbi:hypothetical protein JKP88DRAFT_350416 [Tribonema minus]|uniref:Tim44-like domain-containing protein n=1 Tax=Tribonema minus TaxID=303371 RepID=A0A835YW25_9STRA|nr:hypothetical protein JKP88DRAFT_350416 [Tribonema minus]
MAKRPPVYTLAGLKHRFTVYKGHMKSSAAIAIIKKHVPGFSPKTFPPIADQVFQSFIDAHRKGDLPSLCNLATEGLHDNVKADVTRMGRKPGSEPKPRAAFKLLRMMEPTYVLQVRAAMEKGSGGKRGWGQMTVQYVTSREILAVDRRGREVQPPPGGNKVVESITMGVLEIFFNDPAHTWRLAMLHEVGATGPAEARTNVDKT